jgi:hypothetical protein
LSLSYLKTHHITQKQSISKYSHTIIKTIIHINTTTHYYYKIILFKHIIKKIRIKNESAQKKNDVLERYSVHTRSDFITCICTYETIILHNIKKKLSWISISFKQKRFISKQTSRIAFSSNRGGGRRRYLGDVAHGFTSKN